MRRHQILQAAWISLRIATLNATAAVVLGTIAGFVIARFRRFRLAHVIFHDGIVEVSTFRRAPDPEEQRDPDELLITDDNAFGTPREDAFRRDFTINALFYNVADFSVIDYVGGIDEAIEKAERMKAEG